MKIKAQPKSLKENFISIDPGSEGTGIAIWLSAAMPYQTKILEYKNPNAKWEDRCDYICMLLEHEIRQRKQWLRAVYCEQPQYMQTFKGVTAASAGSLMKLCTIYGRFLQISFSLGIKFIPVDIPKWKGQLSKRQVKFRVDRIIPGNNYTSHAIDAVGIGLYAKGLFS